MAIMFSARLWIFYNRQSMFETEPVIYAPDCPCGSPKVPELSGTVKRCGIDNDMIMDVVLIYMRTDNKGMISFCQFLCKFPSDLVCLFRCDFSGLERLTEMISDHIILSPAPAC